MNYDKIGSFIQQKRKDKGLTQKQLAEKLGVTDRAISKWERGQGCPDVSILEILSKELGCSILELLKGREIENEVIPVTEADDYVRDSMNISKQITKEKVISIINKIIVGTIIVIFMLLLYFNVIQKVYVNRVYNLSIDRETYKKVVDRIKIIDNNLNIIKENKGNYSDDDYEKIVKNLETNYMSIKKEKVFEYVVNRKDIKYTVNDIFTFFGNGYVLNEQLDTEKILEKYSNNSLTSWYRNVMIDNFFNMTFSADFLRTYTSYQYNFNPFANENTFYYVDNEEIRKSIYMLKSDLSQLAYLTELVIEVGDMNE